MANFNRVTLIGNLTRDPQLKQLPNQSAVVEFGLASNRRFKTPDGQDREDVLFIDCAAFGKQAEVLNQYCSKGKSLFIEGRLKYDSWDDKQGFKRNKISVVIETFQFLGGRSEVNNAGTQQELWNTNPDVSAPRRSRREQPQDPALQVKDGDIPF